MQLRNDLIVGRLAGRTPLATLLMQPGTKRVCRRKSAVAGHVLLDAVGREAGALGESKADGRTAGRQIATVELDDAPDRAALGDVCRRDADQIDLRGDDDVNLA